MKRILLSATAVLGFAMAANAQFSSGSFYAGGSLGFKSSSSSTKVGSNSTDNGKQSAFNISPNVGYFVADKLAVGVSVNFDATKDITYEVNNDKTTTTKRPVNINLFARKFFMVKDNFGLFSGVTVGPTFGNSTTENYTALTKTTTKTESKLSGFGARIDGGAIWFPVSKIGIEASVGILGYSVSKSTLKNSNPTASKTEKGFDFLLSSTTLNFGFNYYF